MPSLVFPEQLLPAEREVAITLLRQCKGDPQALLDELSGRLQAGAVRLSPIAYLRGLVRRANAGTFVTELGPRIAQARRDADDALALRHEQGREEARLAAERGTPEYEAKLAARRAEIRQILDALKASPRRGGWP